MSILWTILIGFIAGVLAKLITPGSNEPQGFILTTILGIVGAFVATYLGQALGWYRADEGAVLIGATVGGRDSASGLGRSDSSAQRSLSTESLTDVAASLHEVRCVPLAIAQQPCSGGGWRGSRHLCCGRSVRGRGSPSALGHRRGLPHFLDRSHDLV